MPKRSWLLINNGADIHAKNKKGQTPLHSVKHSEVAKVLIDKGADVNVKDNEGKTPLHVANDIVMIRILVDRGADINAEDNEGKTPAQTAGDNCETAAYSLSGNNYAAFVVSGHSCTCKIAEYFLSKNAKNAEEKYCQKCALCS